MTKDTGLGDQLYVGGYDLGGDINSLSRIGGGNTPIPMTDITQLAMAREGGLRDGGIDFVSYFNRAAGRAHERFSALPRTDVLATYGHGTTLGGPCASCVAKQINYDPQRGQDGSLLFNVNLAANAYGLDWGIQLTAGKRTDSTATNGTGVDLTTVSTLFGWQAYLHVFAFTGTSVTVTLQDSADNVSFANLAGGAFTAATGITFQRLVGGRADTVRRYVRAITTGTFSNAVFFVHFTRNDTEVLF